MGSSSKNKPPENPQKGRAPQGAASPGALLAPQLMGQQMDRNAPAIMGAPTGPQPDPSRGLGPVPMGGPGDPNGMRQMIAKMMMEQQRAQQQEQMQANSFARGGGGPNRGGYTTSTSQSQGGWGRSPGGGRSSANKGGGGLY